MESIHIKMPRYQEIPNVGLYLEQTLSMQNISALFELQKKTYDAETAYNYFCQELEKSLTNVFENKSDDITDDMPFPKKTLSSVVIAISHIIYLNYCFEKMKELQEKEDSES